jgi:hypothetical protein
MWISGLIANLVFWREAVEVERKPGRTPDGKGCLVSMLIVFGLLPVIVTCAAIAGALFFG